MAESGKTRLLAYLLAYVAECVRLDRLPCWCAEVRALAWAATVQSLPMSGEHGVPPLRPAARAELDALMGALEREAAGNAAPLRVLLLSDGGMDHVAQRRWQAWRTRVPLDLRALAVGADASRPALEAMAGKGQTYEAEQIGAALLDWEAAHPAPARLADLQADDWQ